MRSKEIIASIVVVGAVATFAVLNLNTETYGTNFLAGDVEKEYSTFMMQHNRFIGTKEEYKYRLGVYKKNVDFISDFNLYNAEKEGFTLAVNQFADMTKEEIDRRNGFRSQGPRNTKACS